MGKNKRKVSEPGRSAKARIRKAIFERDGFYWHHGEMWMAFCAFGCGELIWGINATLDHYPIKQRDGGRWTVDNLRLACRPCNSADRNHKLTPPSPRQKKLSERKRLRAQRRLIQMENEQNRMAKVESPPSPAYPKSVKQKLKENYPSSKGRDRNGILIYDRPVVYDVAKGKFVYEKF